MHVKPVSYSAVGGEWSQLHAELTGSQLWTSQLIRGDGSEQVSRGNGQCHTLPLQTESKLCNQYDELRGKLGIVHAGDTTQIHTCTRDKTAYEFLAAFMVTLLTML